MLNDDPATSTNPSVLDVLIERRADGSMLITPRAELRPAWVSLVQALEHWALQEPERTFIARRDDTGAWRKLSYSATLTHVRRIAAALMSRQLGPERPIVILSGNGLEHQLLGLAAMMIGVPYAPVSPAYALHPGALERLRHIFALLTPGLVAAFGPGDFDAAFRLARHFGAEIVRDAPPATPEATEWRDLRASPDSGLTRARAEVGPDTMAKFLLTSGSTGHPKAVITTQRMLCANQAMILVGLPCLVGEAPVLVDWLPWNHTFGGSHNVGIALCNGGTLYIDDGRPTAEGMTETVRNLKEIAPSIYFSVPRGFEMLIPYLERDRQLRKRLFSKIRAFFYAGASLSQGLWDALEKIAVDEIGRPVPIISGLGATETGPSITFTTPEMGRAAAIGLPVAGNTIKLVPWDDKLELRVKGANVMPGYWRRSDPDAAVFDEEGYYRLGDAVKLLDPLDPRRGLQFDGRLTEDFKLASGTWVSVGPLRTALMGVLTPWAQDIVIAGHDRAWIGILVFITPAATKLGEDVRSIIECQLRDFSVINPQSSMVVRRAVIEVTPPSLARGEITDKGSINQRAVLKERAASVERLYSATADPSIVVVPVTNP